MLQFATLPIPLQIAIYAAASLCAAACVLAVALRALARSLQDNHASDPLQPPSEPLLAPTEPALAPTLKGIGTALGAYEELISEPSDSPPKLYIIFTPGNPGEPGFYKSYADSLCRRLDAKVIINGLAGHCTRGSAQRLRGTPDAGRKFGTEQQVDHVAARARHWVDAANRANVPALLIGHSIGAFLTLEAALAEWPDPKGSPHVLLLCPFLEVPASVEALPVSFGAKAFAIRHLGWWLTEPCGLLGSLLACVPKPLLRELLSGAVCKMAPAYQRLVVEDLIHRDSVRNVIHLVWTEVAVLAPRYAFERGASRLGRADKLAAAFVPHDEWAPLSMVDRCRSAGIPADVLESDGRAAMQHAFSVKPDSCERVAAWTAELVGARWRLLEARDGAGGAAAPRRRRSRSR